MPTYSFGSGVLWGTRTDIANATPINFGLVQSVSIDETASVKELYGQFQHPVAIARGSVKTSGKATVARISGLAMAHLFYGVAPQAGQVATAFAEAAAVPAQAPYTVNVANAATYVGDHGPLYAATGQPLTKVAGAPAQGQYAVANGVYTFAAGDAGAALLVNYTYRVVASGQSVKVMNQLMGTTPTFSAKFFTTFQGKTVGFFYPNCTSSKFTFGTKLEDFVMPEFDFSCFAADDGTVCQWDFSEVS